jgi:uncharacterized membrane protein
MRVNGLGRLLFAGSLAAIGLLSLVSGDFALNWQPVPSDLPWREALARASGLVLLGCSAGVFVDRTAPRAASVLTGYLLVWLLLLRGPRVAAHPLSAGMWNGFSENVMLLVGGWLLRTSIDPSDGERYVKPARILYALALPFLGLAHVAYVDATTALVPAWLPARTGFTYLTGAGHVAAGLGLLFGILPRLAATLEAGMIGAFTILVWVPRVAHAPASRFEWTAFLISAAVTGACTIVAASLHGAPCGWTERSVPHDRLQIAT